MKLTVFMALFAVALGTVASSASPVTAPALRVVDRSPLTVLGTGFKSRERVIVTAFGDTGRTRVRAVASRRGRFRVELQITYDPCTGPEIIRAAGIKGSIVALKLSLRECPSPVEPLLPV